MRSSLTIAFPLMIAAHLLAQRPADPPQPGSNSAQPAYTLHASSRVVLTDVSVIDGEGNPVHGLKAADFHILDNKKPQALEFFEEHRGTALTPMQEVRSTPGVYSNQIVAHLPPVVNVLVLDITNLGLPEQMYLNYELTRFLKSFPGGQPLAVFLWTGGECLVLQDFTVDHARLTAAVNKGIPRFRSPDHEYITDIAALHQIALYLAPIPGRKNVLWFSGGSTLALLDPSQAGFVDMRPIYDELEADRIAIYPVDARGLTVGGGMAEGVQHLLMEEVADATGGRASYNNNGLDTIASRLVERDRSFYTLTYTPRDFTYDGKWHSVKVEVDGARYSLSYRHGYFADAVQTVPQRREGEMRTRLFADGTRLKVPAENSAPILFEAKVLPADSEAEAVDRIEVKPVSEAVPPKKGKERLAISYSLGAAQFTLHEVNGTHRIEVGAAAILVNHYGRQVGQRADQFTVTIDVDKLVQRPDAKVRVTQEIDAGKGDEYLYLMVWDPLTLRRGFVEVPLQIPVQAARVQTPAVANP